MKLLEFIQQVRPNYQPDWYHLLLIEALEASIEANDEDGILCAAPPGSGKTELFSILFPAWLVSRDSATHIISLANSDSLSRMAASNILRIVQSPDFQDLQPLEFDKATEQTFLVKGNDGRPTLHSAGIKGQLSGNRAKYLIFDDLIKDLSQAYSETVRASVWGNFNSCAETRLLPGGKIYGIHTRWHLDDPIGLLIKRARENERARQFKYICLAATNDGTQSYVLDTRTGEPSYLPPYRSLARAAKQPYSFGPRAIEGKRADLGPTIFSALYQQQPISGEDQMFPPDVWGMVDNLITDDYSLIISTWDTASRDKAGNDPSANVTVGRRHRGDFVVLDATEFRLKFDKLLPVVLERYRRLSEEFRRTPAYLCVEEASSGQQLLDVIAAQFPGLPLLAAKAVHSKIVRAEGVTPFTSARSVSLLKAPWNEQFIVDLANFPASDRDHYVDSFVHAMKGFTGTGSDFQKPRLVPGESQQLTAMIHELAADFTVDNGDNYGREDF